MDKEKKIYLVLIRLGAEQSTISRVRESVPKIKSIIEKLSNKECQLVFTTSDGTSFGYFIKTNTPLRVVRAELFGTSSTSGSSPLLNGDSYLALEISEQFDGVGFSRAWTWLQNHQ